jgi:hypothetical protein
VAEAPPPTPDAAFGAKMTEIHDRLLQTDVAGCEQRYLSPEFPANIELQFTILPGGKTAAVNVVESTAKDGDFDSCVQRIVGGTTFPDPGAPMGFGSTIRFHVGPLDKL